MMREIELTPANIILKNSVMDTSSVMAVCNCYIAGNTDTLKVKIGTDILTAHECDLKKCTQSKNPVTGEEFFITEHGRKITLELYNRALRVLEAMSGTDEYHIYEIEGKNTPIVLLHPFRPHHHRQVAVVVAPVTEA